MKYCGTLHKKKKKKSQNFGLLLKIGPHMLSMELSHKKQIIVVSIFYIIHLDVLLSS